MIDQEPSQGQLTDATPNSKWIAGLRPELRVREAAAAVLRARFGAVCYYLPLAAEKSDEDVEHVHRLRIAIRRAVAGLKTFGDLLDEGEAEAVVNRLRVIRLAADAARNWDVLAARIARGDLSPAAALDSGPQKRGEGARHIIAAYRSFVDDAAEEELGKLIDQAASCSNRLSRRRLGRGAPLLLAPTVKKFFNAVEDCMGSDERLHAIRLRAKKLRYTMEIVATALDPSFRRRLYSRVTMLQDLLGAINDRSTARRLLDELRAEVPDAERQAFFAGFSLAEEDASYDLIASFRATCTPAAIARLQRQFNAYC
jgi:CHAD domain-containing protein